MVTKNRLGGNRCFVSNVMADKEDFMAFQLAGRVESIPRRALVWWLNYMSIIVELRLFEQAPFIGGKFGRS